MNHQYIPGRSQRGLTLIELMVTILIAAILFSVAIPSFKQMTSSSRLSGQTMDMVGAVNIARSEAIKRNRPVTLCRASTITTTNCANSAGSWAYWIIRSVNADGTITIIKRDVINTFSSTMKVASNFTGDAITYGSDGLARNGTAVTGTLINASSFSICTTRPQNSNNNLRTTTVGAGSRITTVKGNVTC